MLLIIFSLVGGFHGEFFGDSFNYVCADSVVHGNAKTSVEKSIGSYLTVKRIFIVGNRLTREKIILRELTYQSGDTILGNDLLQGALELDKKKLVNTRLFNKVEIRAIQVGFGEIDLFIQVSERWYTFPSPIFVLADRNFNEWWQTYDHDISRVNYGLKLNQFNMRGRNEILGLTAQFGFQRKFELFYRFPFIDKKQKQGIAVEFDFSEAKNLAYKTVDHKLHFLEGDDILKETYGGGLAYTFRNSFYNTHVVRISFRNNSVTDSVVFLNPNYFGSENLNQKYVVLSYGFNSDHSDYARYPLSGHHFTAGISKFGLSSLSDVKRWEINATFAKYFELKHKFYLSSYTAGYWSAPDINSYANYSALGYRKQILRGYEIYLIEGPIFFVHKTTFKKLVFSRDYKWSTMPLKQFRHIPFSIYLKTYADIGYVKSYLNNVENNRLTDKYIYSAGVGIDIVGCYDIVIRAEYSFNAEGDNGFFLNLRKEF